MVRSRLGYAAVVAVGLLVFSLLPLVGTGSSEEPLSRRVPSPLATGFGPAGTSGIGAAVTSGVPAQVVSRLPNVATTILPPHVRPLVEVNGTLGGANAEVEQAADPIHHTIYDLWIANSGIGFARSTDGGRTFPTPFLVPGSVDSYYSNRSYGFTWDPTLAVAPNGTLYAAFMNQSSSVPAGSPVVAVSYDLGKSFAFHARVNLPPANAFGDRPFLVVAPNGDVYATWNFAPNASAIGFLCAPGGSCSYSAGDFNVVFARSSDNGHHWSAPVHVSPHYPRGGGLEGPIVVDPSGEIYVEFDAFPTAANYSLSPGQEWFTSSSDGGRHWSAPLLLSGPYRAQLYVWWIEATLQIGPDGVLYAAFDLQTRGQDIGFVRYSTNDGLNWSPLIRVTPDHDAAAHILQVAPGRNGTAVIGWLSNNSTKGWAVYAAVLLTHSNSVSPAYRISSSYGNPKVWPGDTLGMAHLGHHLWSYSWGAQTSRLNDGIYNAVVRFPGL